MRGSWGPESTTQGEWARAEARAPRMKSCPSPRPSQPAVPSSGTVGNTGQVPFSACSPGSGCCLLHCWPHTALGVGGPGKEDCTENRGPFPSHSPLPESGGRFPPALPAGGARPALSWARRPANVLPAAVRRHAGPGRGGCFLVWLVFCCLDLNIFFCFVFCFVIFLFVFLFLPFVVQEGNGGSFHMVPML